MLGLAWSFFLASIVQARDYPLEIIELRSRLPEELIPIVAPLAGADGTVVGAQHALFVRVSPERLADIRRPRGALVRQGQEYRRAERGFSVLPRVQGDRVLLEIETRSESPGRGGAVDTGTLISRIEGRLGDWIPIGASSDSRQSRSGGLLYGTQGRRETQNQVELRVLVLD